MKQKYSNNEILEVMDKRLEENKQLLKGLQEIVSPRWIPVAERLPEEYTDVLVTVYSPYGAFVSTDTYSRGEWQDYNGVKAWMPLPEPYKIDD